MKKMKESSSHCLMPSIASVLSWLFMRELLALWAALVTVASSRSIPGDSNGLNCILYFGCDRQIL